MMHGQENIKLDSTNLTLDIRHPPE